MTVKELIYELENNWELDDEIVVKQGDDEYDIIGITWYADFYGKEGGSSPAIMIREQN